MRGKERSEGDGNGMRIVYMLGGTSLRRSRKTNGHKKPEDETLEWLSKTPSRQSPHRESEMI